MRKAFLNRSMTIMLLLAVSSISLAAEEINEWDSSIFPSPDMPAYAKEQLKEVVEQAQFPQPLRKWSEAGLPGGLEKQVWTAWAPDAPRLWHSIGPGYLNVGWYDQKVDNGVISMLLDLGGLIQSKDGGRTWRTISHHLTISQYYSFDISPADPKIIAIAGAHIDRTFNGGRSWTPVMDQNLPKFKALKQIPGKRNKSETVIYGAIRFNADGSRVFTSPGAFGHGYGNRYGIEEEMASSLQRKYIYLGNGKVSGFKAVDLGNFAGVRYILPHFSDPDLVYLSYSDGSIYVCRNAKADTPTFTALEIPESLKAFQTVFMDVAPNDPNTLLLTMIEQHNEANNLPPSAPSKLVLAKLSANKLNCIELNTGSQDKINSARWNPQNPQEVFVGTSSGKSICISTDGMKSFRRLAILPDSMTRPEHAMGYRGMRKIELDRKSDLAIVSSITDAWSSHDKFRTIENLVMTDGTHGAFFGNKGVAFPECAKAFIRNEYTYLATIDHGAWRSKGADTSQWQKISDNPGMPDLGWARLCYPMAVSDDEAFIYLAGRMNNWSDKNYKLVVSRDKGNSWQDVTSLLGEGEIIKEGIYNIFFDKYDSDKQWILTDKGKKLHFSKDGGKTFKSTAIEQFRNIDGDYKRNILYAASKQGLLRSHDYGFTWTKLPVIDTVPYAVGVLDNGDLVVSDDGRLLVIPYDKIDSAKIEDSMIRMSIGAKEIDSACGQRTFRPIICDGMNILTVPDDGWNSSNCNRDLGPLLSRDGGKSFQWIAYDIPTFGRMAEMRNGKVIIGGRGLYELNLNAIPLPAP